MRTGRVSLWVISVALLSASVTWVANSCPRTSEADEEQGARLLLKCAEAEVPQLLRLLEGRAVQVWDLKTMRQLPTAPAPREMPALRDATRLMGNIFSLVEALGPESSGGHPVITQMGIQTKRARFKISYQDSATPHTVRKALLGHPWMQANVEEVSPGSVQPIPDGRFETSFVLRLKAGEVRAVPHEATSLISLPAVEKATLAANMQFMYASRMLQDRSAKGGYGTSSREYTFNPSTLTQLRTLLQGLSARPEQAVVYELRWKRADEKVRAEKPDAIGKAVVRVGVRTGLGTK